MFAALNSFQTGGAVPVYVSDVFSTTLYAGNSSSQTITNGINLSTNGGLVWLKNRTISGSGNFIFDNARNNYDAWIFTDTTDAQSVVDAIDPTSSGFSINIGGSGVNSSPNNYVSWTFRKQPKFFDVVTYTGNGTTQNIAHSLGGAVGCIIVKNASSVNNWQTWHRGLTSGYRILLNSNAGETNVAIANVFGNNSTYVAPTSTQFTVGSEGAVNQSGETMVAYIFAHDAGGFVGGNVISCGSFTSDSAGLDVTLGYEPQWVMLKVTNSVGLGWYIWDTKRGFVVGTSGGKTLEANSSGAEADTNWISPTATGFKLNAGQVSTGNPFIYIAIKAS